MPITTFTNQKCATLLSVPIATSPFSPRLVCKYVLERVCRERGEKSACFLFLFFFFFSVARVITLKLFVSASPVLAYLPCCSVTNTKHALLCLALLLLLLTYVLRTYIYIYICSCCNSRHKYVNTYPYTHTYICSNKRKI